MSIVIHLRLNHFFSFLAQALIRSRFTLAGCLQSAVGTRIIRTHYFINSISNKGIKMNQDVYILMDGTKPRYVTSDMNNALKWANKHGYFIQSCPMAVCELRAYEPEHEQVFVC